MPKYLDDVKDGDECALHPIRGSTVQAQPYNGQPHPVHGFAVIGTGCAFFDAEGNHMPEYEEKLSKEFHLRSMDEVLARDIAAACRRDFPSN